VKVRFLADADLNKAIVNGLLRSEPSIDFLTAHAAGLRGKKDPEVRGSDPQRRARAVSVELAAAATPLFGPTLEFSYYLEDAENAPSAPS